MPFLFLVPVLAWGDDVRDRTLARVRELAVNALTQLDQRWVDRGGLEIVTGGPSTANTQSRWGHLALRFVGSGASSIEDTVVEVIALSEPGDGFVKIVTHGLAGGYPIVPSFDSLGTLIQSYYFRETRGYSRTIVPSTIELRRALIATLRESVDQRLGLDRYYFLNQNCASYLLWILNRAGFRQLPAPTPFFPDYANVHLRRSFVSPWPEVPGVAAVDLKRLTSRRFGRGIKQLSTLELQRFMVFRGADLDEVLSRIAEHLADRRDLRTTDQVYGIEPLPEWMYQRGRMSDVMPSEVIARFGRARLDHAIRMNWAAERTSYSGAFCATTSVQCADFRAGQRTLLAID